MTQAQLSSPELCDRCGYNRQGLPFPDAACPECGAPRPLPDPINSLTPTQLRSSIRTLRFVFWAAMWLWLSMQALVGWRALGAPGGITASIVLRVFFTVGIGALTLAMAMLAWTPLPGNGGWWWGTRRRGQRLSPCPIGLVLVLPGGTIIFVMTAETLLSRWFGKQIAFLPQDIPQAIIYALILLMIGGGARLLMHAGTVNQHRWREQRRKWFIPWSITATILSAAATSYGMFVNADSRTLVVLSTFMFLPLLLLAITAHLGARRLRERVQELAITVRKPNSTQVVSDR